MDADLKSDLREAVDEVWAESIRLLPLTGGQPDPEREPVEFDAILRTEGRDAEAPNFGRGNAARPAIAASGGVLRIDRMAWPGVRPRKGDRIVALDRAGLPVFEIGPVDDRAHLRLICDVKDA
jgi:hypothetical protein